jgi:hypothetical protein
MVEWEGMMLRRPVRVYADTSVYGGAFEDEFREGSLVFFEQVRAGRFDLVISALCQDEIEGAPPQVRDHFDGFVRTQGITPVTHDAYDLHDGYLRAGVVGESCEADALHVAIASVAGCVLLVSWNFRHIVHYRKVALYNAVNVAAGYPELGIFAPWEVVTYDDADGGT